MKRNLLIGFFCLFFSLAAHAQYTAGSDVPVRDFFRHAEFTSVSLSLDGKHLAVTVPEDDRTLLAVLSVDDRNLVGKWDYGENMHIQNVYWVNNERIVFQVAEKLGSFDFRVQVRDLYASNIDGTGRVDIPNGNTYRIIDRVQGQPTMLWVERSIDDAFLFRLDTEDGRVLGEAVVDIDSGSFLLDHDDNVRYAVGMMEDRRIRTLRRDGEEWVTVHETTETGSQLQPLGFHADNERVYFRVTDEGEPARVVLRDPETGEQQTVSENETVDPAGLIWSHDDRHLLAVRYEDGLPSYDIVSPDHPQTRLIVGLIRAFPEHAVNFSNMSEDGSKIVFRVYSDMDPGSFYLYDLDTGEAIYLLSNRNWIDPEQMSPMRPVRYTARDGRQIHGYLTVPKGLDAENLPLVLLVHGGPHGIRDFWGFDPQVQFLASRGYAVLQPNYRGSGGYGQEFRTTGYRNWGTTMQDDLTDAVHWAVEEGIADPDRVCIFGASYGGYAALMSPVREPDLYRCTIGYVGVYSIPMMFSHGDIPGSRAGRNYQERILPETRAEQERQSPAYNVQRLKAPVMLVHGNKDERVPIQQMRFLVKQLEDAGKPPEVVVTERNEGHGFYDLDNNVNLYNKIQAFLDRHIGGP